jgi:hypothetical protein
VPTLFGVPIEFGSRMAPGTFELVPRREAYELLPKRGWWPTFGL